MASAGKMALIPLLAVATVLGVSGLHGRRTHDPTRADRALELLGPTQDPLVAKDELHAFFETGWVNWEVKTAVEIACGSQQGRNIADPLLCVAQTRSIILGHQCDEQRRFRTYTWLAWSALAPSAAVVVLLALQLAASRRKKG